MQSKEFFWIANLTAVLEKKAPDEVRDGERQAEGRECDADPSGVTASYSKQ